MVDAIDAWVDVIFFAVATASSATAPAELKFHQLLELLDIHLRELIDDSLSLQELTLRSQEHDEQWAIVDNFEKGHELVFCRLRGERMRLNPHR